jgi:hypothetical protein
LACPFFTPTERADDIAFPHPARLPLGASWRGSCSAKGQEATVLNQKELESCNLGYARSCPRLPKERPYDSVRFGIARDSGDHMAVQFVLESRHRPAGHGILHFDQLSKNWISPHPDPLIQKKAECFLQSYLERTSRP